jgi:hypothetical protein
MSFNRKDLATGAIFAAFALFYGYLSLTTVPVGTPLRMGPGFFPVMLCVALLAVALFLIGRSFVRTRENPFGEVSWRALVLVTLSVIVFALTAKGLGMLPAVFVSSLVACAASPRITPVGAVLTSAGIAVFCTLVFTIGLNLPLPAFGTWIAG